jgi:hypothetical protein
MRKPAKWHVNTTSPPPKKNPPAARTKKGESQTKKFPQVQQKITPTAAQKRKPNEKLTARTQQKNYPAATAQTKMTHKSPKENPIRLKAKPQQKAALPPPKHKPA